MPEATTKRLHFTQDGRKTACRRDIAAKALRATTSLTEWREAGYPRCFGCHHELANASQVTNGS